LWLLAWTASHEDLSVADFMTLVGLVKKTPLPSNTALACILTHTKNKYLARYVAGCLLRKDVALTPKDITDLSAVVEVDEEDKCVTQCHVAADDEPTTFKLKENTIPTTLVNTSVSAVKSLTEEVKTADVAREDEELATEELVADEAEEEEPVANGEVEEEEEEEGGEEDVKEEAPKPEPVLVVIEPIAKKHDEDEDNEPPRRSTEKKKDKKKGK